ncbi:MAG: hypothetical protein ACOC2N_08130, partial [Spirochaetota bacterium]
VSQYYFLVASLPLLSYENRDAMEPDDYLAMLADHLSPANLQTVASARIDAPASEEESGAATGNATIESWTRFERGLRNTLVHLRASGSADPNDYVRLDRDGNDNTEPVELAEAAREAYNHESPLSGEDILNRARWFHLDELEVGHFFDLDRVIVYYLKLQILARRRIFTRSEGERQFAAINERIMNDYYQERSE